MNFKLHLQCSWPDVVSNLPGPDQSNSSVRPLPKPLVGSTATWKSCCCPQMGSQNMHVQSISNTEVSVNLHTQSWWSVGTNKTIRSCVLWERYPPQFVNSFLPSVLHICIHRHNLSDRCLYSEKLCFCIIAMVISCFIHMFIQVGKRTLSSGDISPTFQVPCSLRWGMLCGTLWFSFWDSFGIAAAGGSFRRSRWVH